MKINPPGSPHNRCPLVALVGRPNVGKSTLFNRLTRTGRAIVDSRPGVTRDRHYQQMVWDDLSLILVDTGGIETGSREGMAGMIVEQALQAVAEADHIIFLLDGKQGPMPDDYQIADLLRRSNKPVYYAVNKIDGPEKEDVMLPPFYEMGVEELWPISSAHGVGIQGLMDKVAADFSMVADNKDLPENTLRLACVGRPNAGKSSLINRILGSERMVVSEVPGTTRDSVDTLLDRRGRHYLLIDTAGIRRRGKVREKLEKFSVMQALAALERCDIALLIIDAGEGIAEQDTKILGYCLERGRACLVLLNKWDLVGADKKRGKKIVDDLETAVRFAGYAPVLTISALTGAGVKRIFSTLDKIHVQYERKFTTGRLNKLMQKAIEAHPPSLYRGKRLKLYYTTQVSVKPPTFIIFANYPAGVHFSYHRYLVNQFRDGLGLDLSPLKIILKKREGRR